MADFSTWNRIDIKKNLLYIQRECSQRGLTHSSKWSSELMVSLGDIRTFDILPDLRVSQDYMDDYDRFMLARSYFDLKEFDRAAHVLKDCKSNEAYFLHIYSRYMAGEKRRTEDMGDSIAPPEKIFNEHLRTLRAELQTRHSRTGLDGFCLYIYGVILRKLDLQSEAVRILVDSINSEPLHWGTWLELAILISDKQMLKSLSLPDHWMKQFFLGHLFLELQLNEEAFQIYTGIQKAGLHKSSYVQSQVAIYHHNIMDADKAVEVFTKLIEQDPYQLERMDTYSNILYVKEMRAELAYLSHHCCEVDKYRVETCCVIGNYYSLRGQHEKAVLYFQRALKLNPFYLSAWTLMGHEFMEKKNSNAAIQAYRQAIEVNKRDYRAWYGLGQTYEILKMPFYCLYYYRQAQKLRPNDSRMVVALGETYEKLEKLQEAKKCFWKAHSIGDMEGSALIKLAKLYEKLFEEEQAAVAYTEYINEAERNNGTFNYDELGLAYRYLANFHLKHNRLNEAYAAATKCSEFNEVREEGKALLRQIANLRSITESSGGNNDPAPSERPPQVEGTPMSRLTPMNLTFD